MRVTRREPLSRKWRNERWIFWAACPVKMRAAGEPLRIACPRALSFFSPRLPRRQVLASRRALEKRTRTGFPPLLGPGQGLPSLHAQASVLSGKSQRRPGNFATGGERCSSGVPAEDGNRASAGKLPPPRKSGRVL